MTAEPEIIPMSKAVARKEPETAPAPVSESAAIIQMIERAARDPAVDLDKMQRLLEMREKIDAQAREREFNERMAAAQQEMRPVSADANNPQTKSKYASYAALDRALRPIYTKAGFALSFNTAPEAPADHVRIVCDVANCGHTRRYQIDMPADGKGAKGGDAMTKTHATGSAASYGMRYLLKMIFNVAVGEADDDGNNAGKTAPVERITEEQVNTLNELILKTEEPAATVQIIFEHWKVASLADLTRAQFGATVTQLKKKLGKFHGA